MIIRTNPPGALCYVDDHEVGLTPVAVSPIYYGNRKIRLVKDGCETLTVIQAVPPPWYEIPPLDFFAENAVPGKISDIRTYDFQLYPQTMVPREELLLRAENLRQGTQSLPGVTMPGLRVDTPPTGQTYVPAPGTPGGPPIGSQPYHQLPPPATTMPDATMPAGPVYTPPPGATPVAPPAGGAIYQPPPATPPSTSPGTSGGPSNFGSQPYFPLPAGQ